METSTVKICGLMEIKYPECRMISGTKRTKGGGVLEVLSGKRGCSEMALLREGHMSKRAEGVRG